MPSLKSHPQAHRRSRTRRKITQGDEAGGGGAPAPRAGRHRRRASLRATRWPRCIAERWRRAAAKSAHPLLDKREAEAGRAGRCSPPTAAWPAASTPTSSAHPALHRRAQGATAGARSCSRSSAARAREYYRRRAPEHQPRDARASTAKTAADGARDRRAGRSASSSTGKIDAVFLVYNEFKSAISSRSCVEPLLPISAVGRTPAPTGRPRARSTSCTSRRSAELLDALLPLYVEIADLPRPPRAIASELRRADDRHGERDQATRRK